MALGVSICSQISARAAVIQAALRWAAFLSKGLPMSHDAPNSKCVIAHHRSIDGNMHSVAAQMRVLVCPAQEGGFVAQGLEIDYCSVGDTVEEVQENFATGFLATIQALIRGGRPLTALFKSSTPAEVWSEYLEGAKDDQLICATVVDLSSELPLGVPYQQLAFCSPRQMSLA